MSTTNVNPTPHEWRNWANARHHFRCCVACNRTEIAGKHHITGDALPNWFRAPHQLPSFSPFFHHACSVPRTQFVLEPTGHLAVCG